MNTASWTWLNVLKDVMEKGQESKPRDMRIKELLGYKSKVSMQYPVVSVVERKLQRKFLGGEAYWILSGDNRVSTISPYNSVIAKFSDDGRYFNGAYGPRVVDQISYVVDSLVKDHDSRQAVMTIWRPNPRPSKDIPCTVAVQWFLRKKTVEVKPTSYPESMNSALWTTETIDEIHCVDTMRSSDCWLGWPYDVFNFSMLSSLIALMYRERTGINLSLGQLTMQCGSQHVYDNNWEAVSRILYGESQNPRSSVGEVPCVPYAPLDLNQFKSVDDFMRHLANIRDGISDEMSFMREFNAK